MIGAGVLRACAVAAMVIAAIASIWYTAGLALDRSDVQRFDAGVRSALAADYSADFGAALRAPLAPEVIEAAADDEASVGATPTPPVLGDPLPFIDRAPASATPTATFVLVATTTASPTRTGTPEPTETSEPTSTETPPPTGTPEPTWTPEPTDTPEPAPTSTRTPICVVWSGGSVPNNNKRTVCTATPTVASAATNTPVPTEPAN